MQRKGSIKTVFTLFILLVGLINGKTQKESGITPDTPVRLDTTTRFENYTLDDGLPSNQINDILQDRYGYFWFATSTGLCRFDGVNFVNYYHNNTDSTTLSNNYITRLVEDSNGQLWVGTKYGLNKLNRKDYTFQRFYQESKEPNSLPGNHIRAFLADTASIVWLETNNGFFSRLDVVKNKFENYGHHPGTGLYPSHTIKKLKNGEIFIAGQSQPIFFNTETKKQKKGDGFPLSGGFSSTGNIFEDELDNYWLTHTHSALTIFNKTNLTFQKIPQLTSIYDITTDENNNLWAGGYSTGASYIDREKGEIIRYYPNISNPYAIQSKFITKIYIDKVGDIWFATNNGISKLKKNRPIKHFVNPSGSNNITALAASKNDSILWIATADKGLYKYDLKNKRYLKNYQRPDLLYEKLQTLHLDKNDLLWIGHWSGLGFQTMNTQTDKFNNYQVCQSNTSDWWTDILETSKGEIYLASWGLGPKKFDRELNHLSAHHLLPSSRPAKSPFRTFHLMEDQIMIYSGRYGVTFYDIEQNLYYSLTTEEPDIHQCLHLENPLWAERLAIQAWSSGNIIYSFKKIEENYWISSLEGVYKINAKTLQGGNTNFRIKGDSIIDIHFNAQNRQWIGLSHTKLYFFKEKDDKSFLQLELPKNIQTYRSATLRTNEFGIFVLDKTGFQKYDTQTQTWHTLSFEEENLKDFKFTNNLIWWVTKTNYGYIHSKDFIKRIRSIPESHKFQINNLTAIAVKDSNNLWFGTDKGVFHLKENVGKITTFKHNPLDTNTIPHDKIWSIDFDSNNNLWIGTQLGLAKYDQQQQQIIRYNQFTKDGIASSYTKCMTEDKAGNVWFGSTNGYLDRWNRTTNVFDHFANEPWNPKSIQPDALNNAINSVYSDTKGRVWIGTGNLSLFNPQSNDFRHFYPNPSTPFYQLLSITEDEIGNLWLGTDRGLFMFNPRAEKFSFFGLSDNIQSLEFTEAACQLASGAIILGGKNGFNIIQPKEIVKKSFQSSIDIFRFNASDEVYIADLIDSSTIQLAYNQNEIQLDVALSDYSPKNLIKYKLSNYEDGWQLQDALERTIQYKNLPSGNYKLQIFAGNGLGEWTKAPRVITFSIATPFWKSWLFLITLFSILIGMIIWGVSRFQKSRLAEKEKKIQLQFLQVKSLQTQMNPHFIFNAIGTIQKFIVHNEAKEAKMGLDNLATLIRRFLDSSIGIELPKKGTKEGEIPLTTEEELLRMYIEFEQLQHEDTFDYSMTFDPQIVKDNYWIPSMIIQPYIENAIKHGFLSEALDKKGQLIINFDLLADEALSCIITDNGIGRKKAGEKQRTSKHIYISHGTALVDRRVALLNQLGYDIAIETKDNPIGGTIVSIKINKDYDR